MKCNAMKRRYSIYKIKHKHPVKPSHRDGKHQFPPPPPQSSKTRSIKWFGKNISQRSLCINVSYLDISFFNMVSQEIVSPFKVSHSFVEDWVFAYKDGTDVIAHEGNSLKDHSKSLMVCTIHRIWKQQLHTWPLWWIEQLKIVFKKTSKQEKIQENDM
jgi:hypothetical protein